VLAYHESSANSELKIFDRSGNVVATPGPLAAYHSPRFSPDGKSISADVRDPKTGKDDVWIYPVAGGQPTRITFGPDDYRATWSPDGREIAYAVHDGNKLSVISGRWMEAAPMKRCTKRLILSVQLCKTGRQTESIFRWIC